MTKSSRASYLSFPNSNASGLTSFLLILVHLAEGGTPSFFASFSGATPSLIGAGSSGNFSRGARNMPLTGALASVAAGAGVRMRVGWESECTSERISATARESLLIDSVRAFGGVVCVEVAGSLFKASFRAFRSVVLRGLKPGPDSLRGRERRWVSSEAEDSVSMAEPFKGPSEARRRD